ncbi:MAG: oligosaccharide flippase family protein [Bacteroidota bacterium]|nr:oligosaccharide flippase family protein [Bacteroidota bacterium]
MFEQIKRLGTDTAIYGISTIVARLLNFILLPLYANILSPSEFGIQANIYAYIAFFILFYGYGMESAYFRFASSKELGSEKDNFSTPYISILIVSAILSIVLFLFAAPLTSLFMIDVSMYQLIYYASGILFFDAIVLVPFASLRLQRKAKYFASIKVINIGFTIVLNIILVYKFRWGIEGIFISNLAASLLSFLMLLPTTIRQFEFSFHKSLFKELLKFGLPILPVGISGILLQLVDRPILLYLMNEASVGIYQANFRLGIFMALVTGMFEFAWRPFFLSHAKDPNAKVLFSRVMTYYLAVCAVVFLLISLFVEDVIKFKFQGHYILRPEYWDGLAIVPLVLISYIFSGIGTNLNAGIQIEKKTKYLFPTSFSGSLTKIILTFILVPKYGIMGAAYATIFGYMMVEITLYLVVQKFYYIEYEFARIGKLVLTVAIAFIAAKVFFDSVLIKFVILFTWFFSLFLIGFFTSGELLRLKNFFGKKS